MKIVQLVCVYPPYRGGIGNVARKFFELAKNYGHESWVFTPEYKKDIFDLNEPGVLRLKTFIKYGNAAFLPQLVFRLKKFDIVYLHYPFFGADIFVWISKILYRQKFKLIIHYHMDVIGLPFYLKPFVWPSQIIFNSLVAKADLVTCASFDYLENSLVRKVFLKYKEKFKEIPFGVDLEKFEPIEKKNENSTIVFVGGLDSAHFFKGLDLLIMTLAKIQNLPWSLTVIGSGNLLHKYKLLVSSLSLENRIFFEGDIDNEMLAKTLAKGSFLVLSAINRNEAFGLVLLEAFASGIPVVACDLPGVRSVFRDKIEGLYFRTGDSKDLEEKIRWMLAHQFEAKKMGKSGREMVAMKYDWKIIGKRINDLYVELTK